MSRQSLDMRYGRQGGRIVPWNADHPEERPTCIHCGHPVISGENSHRVCRPMEPIDVAHAALLEAGRSDLAETIEGFEDEDGFYLESDEWILTEDDWAVINKAEALARASAGDPPREYTNESENPS